MSGSYWSKPKETLGIRIELIQASTLGNVGQDRQELGQCQKFQMRQKVLWAGIPPQNPLSETQKEMKAKYPHIFVISVHIFTKLINFEDEAH